MKTTIEIDDGLFATAKKVAAERRCTLRQLVHVALRKEVAPRARPKPGWMKKLERFMVPGALPPDLDVASRASIYEWLGRHGGPSGRGR